MPVRETSREAYDELIAAGVRGNQQMVIAEYLYRRKRLVTRAQIAAGLGIRINAVCGRVNEMLQAGILEEPKKIKDPFSGRYVWGVCYRRGVDHV